MVVLDMAVFGRVVNMGLHCACVEEYVGLGVYMSVCDFVRLYEILHKSARTHTHSHRCRRTYTTDTCTSILHATQQMKGTYEPTYGHGTDTHAHTHRNTYT